MTASSTKAESASEMVETEDEVQSIQSNATVQSISKDTNQDMPLDTLKGKSALVDREEDETITTTQVTSTKGDDGEEKVVTTTQTSTKMGDGGIAQRVTKVTKTKKVVKKVTKVKKEEEEEEEEETEEETKDAVSITELSDEEKPKEQRVPKPSKTTQQKTSVRFLKLFCLYIYTI